MSTPVEMMVKNIINSNPTPPPTWGNAVATPAKEFPLQPLAVLAGQVPPELQGSCYRNGSGRLQRGGQTMGHWFDGDGAILAIHFAAGQARGTYRYVQTAGYVAESQADRLLYSNYGLRAPGAAGMRRGVKNAANTSVLALPDRLLALWEGGAPHALDLEDLTTVGLTDLGTGNFKMPYSAHPKVDPQTGEIFNFGVAIGAKTALQIYQSDRTGRVVKSRSIPLGSVPLIHDFALAGQYLVFCMAPVRIQLLPILLNQKSFSEAMVWRPHLGTQILVIDRETLEPLPLIETDPWFQWHLGHGYTNAAGQVVVEVVRYEDFQTNQFLRDVTTGQTNQAVAGQLWQLIIDPHHQRVVSNTCLVDRGCEFPLPVTNDLSERHTYLSVQKLEGDLHTELLGDLACYDHQTAQLTTTNLPAHLYPSEPIFAQDWILATIYDSQQHRSEVWIWHRDRLAAEPQCRLQLPTVIPMGFHGTWRSMTN
jgi:all-trans-8'-apo-beta-carotenal 15,15'-oxygenase